MKCEIENCDCDCQAEKYLDGLRRGKSVDSSQVKFFGLAAFRRDPGVHAFLQAWRLGQFASFESCLLKIVMYQCEELNRLKKSEFERAMREPPTIHLVAKEQTL